MNTVRADFDRLALLESDAWNHNNHYHAYLLRHVPAGCQQSLEVGCGSGAFARLLARRSGHVLGLDLSPQMIAIAAARSRDYANVEYQTADVLTWPFPLERYDCIASIATLHHLPFEPTVARMKAALRPGGALLILDLYQSQGLGEHLSDALAMPASLTLKLLRTGRLRESREVQVAWAQHGRTDVYLPLSSVRRMCANLLPGARVRRRLFWRYSVVWVKPGPH